MKKLLILFVFFANISSAQELSEKKFDKFDSLFSVVTKDMQIGRAGMEDFLDSATYAKLMDENTRDSMIKTDKVRSLFSDPKFLESLNKPNLYIKVGRYVKVKNKKPQTDNISAYVLTLTPEAMSFDENTNVKVIFEDDSIKEYKNEASFKTWGKGEPATMYFSIPKNDPFYTKSIKAVRLQNKGFVLAVDADARTKDNVKKMISLVRSQDVSYN